MKLLAVPAVIEDGYPEMIKLLAAAGLTAIPVCEPVMLLVTVSVAVMDWVPAVFNVALNEPVPLLRVALAGRLA
jgi:hypothetical protein